MVDDSTGDVRDVVIVGGGAAGIAAAWQLRDKDMVLLEASDVLGGRMKSVERDGYWLNLGGHIFPAGTSLMRTLIDELSLDTIAITGSKTAMCFEGKVYAPRRIESFPLLLPLSARDRAQLVKVGLKIRLKVRALLAASRLRSGETETERRARVSKFESNRTFGELVGKLPASVASIFATAARRAPAEVHELSASAGLLLFAGNWSPEKGGPLVNLRGGSGRIGEAAHRRLGERVVLGARVASVEQDGDLAVVRYETDHGQFSVAARRVIVATPAPVASKIVKGLPPAVESSLQSVMYQPFVCMAVLTKETGPMPWDDIYAVLTPGMAFNMLFNHANPLRGSSVRASGGSLMCYAGGQPGREMLDLPDGEIQRRFTQDLVRVYPQLAGIISETIVQKWPYGNCNRNPDTDVEALLNYSREPSNVIQFAGDYFGEISGNIEVATRSGIEAARNVLTALDAESRP